MHILAGIYDALIRSDFPNMIQVASGFAAAYAWRKFICKKSWCARLGKHQVQGTTYKTCSRHCTQDVHELLRKQHAIKRPDQHRFLNKAV